MDIKNYIESGIIESYVLGIATAEEIIDVDNMRANYTEVQEAIDEFSTLIEEQAFKNAIAPPTEIKQRLMAELNFDNKAEKPLVVAFNSTKQLENTPPPVKHVNMWRYVAAASVILFVASAIGNILLYNKYNSTNEQYMALLSESNTLQANNKIYQVKLNQYQTASQMMADPTVIMVKMSDPNKKEDNVTTVFWDNKTKDVYLMANKLPAPAPDKQYQLWALVDGTPVDAGMLDPQCTSLCRMKNIPKAQAFAITLEKAGGSPVPTMAQLYVLGNI